MQHLDLHPHTVLTQLRGAPVKISRTGSKQPKPQTLIPNPQPPNYEPFPLNPATQVRNITPCGGVRPLHLESTCPISISICECFGAQLVTLPLICEGDRNHPNSLLTTQNLSNTVRNQAKHTLSHSAETKHTLSRRHTPHLLQQQHLLADRQTWSRILNPNREKRNVRRTCKRCHLRQIHPATHQRQIPKTSTPNRDNPWETSARMILISQLFRETHALRA